jgi:heme/copper-type cytochrome/quinol oxidase subunit 4
MKGQQWEQMSSAELEKKLSALKKLMSFFLVCWIALTIIALYITITDKFSPLIATSTALLPIFIVNKNNIKKIELVLQERKDNSDKL